MTSRVIRSSDASPAQRTEALRLRALAHAEKQLFSDAVRVAEEALTLEPDATTILSDSDLRQLVSYWKRIPDRFTGSFLGP